MKTYTAFITCILLGLSLFAQSSKLQYSFKGNGHAVATNIIPLTDQGYLMVGSSGNGDIPTFSDMLLMKTDAKLELEWSTRYKSYYTSKSNGFACPPQAHLEYAASAVEVSDGYVLVGSHDRKDGALCSGPNTHLLADFDLVVMKVDKMGQPVWTRRFGNNSVQMGTHIQQTSDGGFIVSGFANTGAVLSAAHPFLLKLDAQGQPEWSRIQTSFNFQGLAALLAAGSWRFPIIELKAGGYAYLASTGNETFLVRLDAQGNTQWAKRFFHSDVTGHINQSPDWAVGAASYAFFHSLVELPNGHITFLGNLYFALAIVIDPNQPLGTFFAMGGLVEVDQNGLYVNASVFSHPTGHSPPLDLVTTDMELLPNGNLLIAGLNEYRSFVLEYDHSATTINGHSQWAKSIDIYHFNGIPYGHDLPSVTYRNGQAIMLYDNFKVGVTALNSQVDSCARNWGPIHSLPVASFAMPDVTMQMRFDSTMAFVPRDTLVLLTEPIDSLQRDLTCGSQVALSIANLLQRPRQEGGFLLASPNPWNSGELTLRFEAPEASTYQATMMDLQGRTWAQQTGRVLAGENRLRWQADVPQGLYMIRVVTSNGQWTTKVVRR